MYDGRLDIDLGDGLMPGKVVQQQQVPQGVRVEVRYCIPDDQARLMRGRSRAPAVIPPGVPLPPIGGFVFLNSSAAWTVETIITEWRSPADVQVQVWLQYAGPAHEHRPNGSVLTQ